jgi:hypothetical protein
MSGAHVVWQVKSEVVVTLGGWRGVVPLVLVRASGPVAIVYNFRYYRARPTICIDT